MPSDVPSDPAVLQVQWLEDSLLVHALTLEGSAPRREVHWLLAGACLGAVGVAAAMAAGAAPWAALPAAVWTGCALGLGRLSWQTSRALPPAARRLLIELRPERIAWTLLAGDRWSMLHDHDLAVSEILGAAPIDTPIGWTVRISLRAGPPKEIPLHGLPSGDAAWLCARIGDLQDAFPLEG